MPTSGTLVRYADDFVVMCKTKQQCEQAERACRSDPRAARLELHPEKTRRVELYDGKQGFDFLGCHLRKRLSGPIWEREAEAHLLPASLAVAARDEADPAAREGADATRAMPRGHPRGHRRPQPDSPRMGRVLPHRERRAAASTRSTATCTSVYVPCASSAQGRTSTPAQCDDAGRATTSGASDSIACAAPSTTRRLPNTAGIESPPVSRVREIRTHGLNGGRTETPKEGK